MRKQAWLALALAVMTGVLVDSAGAQLRRPTLFTARLTGSAERPEPVASRSFGTATIRVDPKRHKMDVDVTVNSIVDLEQAHIHLGGVDEAGPVVVRLYGPAETVGRERGRLFTKTVTAGDIINPDPTGEAPSLTLGDLLDEMQQGNAYINLHTTAHPSGEIRGQIRTRSFR